MIFRLEKKSRFSKNLILLSMASFFFFFLSISISIVNQSFLELILQSCSCKEIFFLYFFVLSMNFIHVQNFFFLSFIFVLFIFPIYKNLLGPFLIWFRCYIKIISTIHVLIISIIKIFSQLYIVYFARFVGPQFQHL